MEEERDSLSIEQASRIDALCDRFEAELRTGGAVAMESCLEQVEAPLRPVLFRELLGLEIDYRLRQEQQPNAKEYLDRYPDFEETVIEVLGGLTTEMQASPPRVTCPQCQNPIPIRGDVAGKKVECATCHVTIRIDADDKVLRPRTENETPSEEVLRRVDQFELLKLVGRGGFGSVYQARDTELDRTVAIKVPRSSWFASEAEEQAFVREARSSAHLEHSGIVTVYGVGRWKDFPYIVSEFIVGSTLAEALSDQRISFQETAEIAAQVAEAVSYAHEQGVIHRDLKPSNIMLRSGDKVEAMLMDFGLARRQVDDVTVTMDGQIMGTPAYMSPEQARGANVDGRTDIYSIGVLLYELLAGELPFRGNMRMLIDQLQHAEPRAPRSLNDRIPLDLETICLKCMEKEPARRFQSAQDLAVELRRFQQGIPIVSRPVSRPERALRWCKRKPLQASMIAIVLVATVVVTSLWFRAELAIAQQVDGLVKSLVNAMPPAITAVVDDMAPLRSRMHSRLKNELADAIATDDVARQIRLSLALLPGDSSQIAFLKQQLLEADAAHFVPIRDMLAPRSDELLTELWDQLGTAENSDAARLRAAAALAAYDASDPRWKELASIVLTLMLQQKSADLFQVWLDALRPASPWFGRDLVTEYERSKDPVRQDVIAQVGADYYADAPEILTSLALIANSDDYRQISDSLVRHRDRVVGLLRRDLNSDGKDHEGATVADQILAKIAHARGLVRPEFAFCQDLGLEQLKETCAELSSAGYRVIRARPFLFEDQLRIAVIWRHDGLEGRVELLDAPDVVRTDRKYAAEGLQAVDLAAWIEPDDAKRLKFAAVWKEAHDGPNSRLAPGMYNPFKEKSLPITIHYVPKSAQFSEIYSRVLQAFHSAERHDFYTMKGEYTAEQLASTAWQGVAHYDITSYAAPDGSVRYAAIRGDAPLVEEVLEVGIGPDELLARAREHADNGFQIQALSITTDRDGLPNTASVWHRQRLPREERLQAARLRANSVAILAQLGELEPLWQHLSWTSSPDVRAYLNQRVTSELLALDTLVERLRVESDTSVRRAICWLIGNYPPDSASPSLRAALIEELTGMFRTDPDPGLHASAGWLLRKWAATKQVAQVEERLARSAPAERRWYINGQGHTMLTVPGPSEFLMGEWRDEPRRTKEEIAHHRKIDRTFAISSGEVTVEQFLQFRPKHEYEKDWSPHGTCPVGNVSWFCAAAYCNWLSEQEGIPQDQWCYPLEVASLCVSDPSLTETRTIKMPRPNDYLDRTGYRLPTEAEWEFASRAGAKFTSWHFGNDEQLLQRYAWYRKNAREQSHPIKSLLPNDYGLFDVHGNAYEWCDNHFAGAYPKSNVDSDPILDAGAGTIEDGYFVARGGSVGNPPSRLRTSKRDIARPSGMSMGMGFRVARTHK